MTRMPLEESYLHHILIAVHARDASAPFRTFFDNWYAFSKGGPFLNRNSRPHWFNNPCPRKHGEALSRNAFVSANAARTLSGLSHDRLVKDHAIPVAVLRSELFDRQPKDVNEVRSFLKTYFNCGIVTKEEDSRLTAAGLRSAMPSGWTFNDSVFARYMAVGIQSQDLKPYGRNAFLQHECKGA